MASRTFLPLVLVVIGAARLYAGIDPLQRAAAELAAGLKKNGPAKVAVLAVPHHDKHASDGPFLVSERLTAYLGKEKSISLVERQRLLQVLAELHLSEAGTLDSKTAKLLGKALGADILVTGSLIDLPKGQTEVNLRGILSENGRIVAAGRGIIDRTWAGRPVLGDN